MSEPGKIFILNPRENLLKRVTEEVLSDDKPPHLKTILLPNRRAGVYLKHYMAQTVRSALLLPRIIPLDEWIVDLYLESTAEPREQINDFDASWIAFEAYNAVCKASGVEPHRWDSFFPWARHMLDALNEFDFELVDPTDVEIDDVPHPLMLRRIKGLYGLFGQILEEKGLITKAKVFRLVAEAPERFLGECVKEMGDEILVVGFYALTESEDRIFRYLFEHGARFYWHTTSNPLPRLYRRWKEKWGVKPVDISEDCHDSPTRFHFFEAHDLHSEIKELKRRLREMDSPMAPDEYCIVPLMPTSLIPLLYHLEEVPANVTMGYPLSLTGPYRYLELLFSIVENWREGAFRVRDLEELFLHPYSGLSPLVELLRESLNPFFHREQLFEMAGEIGLKKEMETIFRTALDPIIEARTTADLAEALESIVSFVRSKIKDPSLLDSNPNYSMELVALETIEEELIPLLSNGLFSKITMKKSGLIRFFREISHSCRIALEGEPLHGLQVMGLLETRLINFHTLLFLDTNDSILPGIEDVNPVLPHGIRRWVGLPERGKEELILRYHFERLVNSAKEVHIFWRRQFEGSNRQSQVEPTGLKSRFVERIIWDLEKEAKQPVEDTLIKRSKVVLHASVKDLQHLKKGPEHIEIVRGLMRHISPTGIETYLRCPRRFFYRYVMNIEERKGYSEIDYGEIGNAVHNALERYYRRLISKKKEVTKSDLLIEELFNCFLEEIKGKRFYRYISPERRRLLERSAYHRLNNFIKNQPDTTKVIALEKELSHRIYIGGDPALVVVLSGRIDRIDLRDGLYVILDYKTGLVDQPKNISAELIDLEMNEEGLKLLYERFKHIQLPLYAYLFCVTREGAPPWDSTICAYVDLRKSGKEELYHNKKFDFGRWLEEVFPHSLDLIFRHMLEAPYWYPAPDLVSCRFCGYNHGCFGSAVGS